MSYYGITDQAAKEAQVAEVIDLHKEILESALCGNVENVLARQPEFDAAVRKLANLPADSETPAQAGKV